MDARHTQSVVSVRGSIVSTSRDAAGRAVRHRTGRPRDSSGEGAMQWWIDPNSNEVCPRCHGISPLTALYAISNGARHRSSWALGDLSRRGYPNVRFGGPHCSDQPLGRMAAMGRLQKKKATVKGMLYGAV
ncbi:MAG: hypothetical protein AAGG72_06250 [Pseudomonadota bacterium]